MAIRSDQRLVELAEHQSLAVVRRMGRVRWIDRVAEGNGRNRFARFSDQRTVGGSGLGIERPPPPEPPVAALAWREPDSGVLAAGPAVTGRAVQLE